MDAYTQVTGFLSVILGLQAMVCYHQHLGWVSPLQLVQSKQSLTNLSRDTKSHQVDSQDELSQSHFSDYGIFFILQDMHFNFHFHWSQYMLSFILSKVLSIIPPN